MSERGVFAVDRGIFDHPLLSGEPYTRVQAFVWLVAEAAWKPHRRRLGAVAVDLKRGQAACSLRFMAEKWGWSEPKVRRFLARLKTDAMIDAATDAGITVVTVCNYDTYQRVSLPSDAPTDADADAEATQQRRKGEDREYKEVDPPSVPKGTSAPKGPKASDEPRATRIPDDFEHWPEAHETVVAAGYHPDQVADVLGEFCDYWRPLPKGPKATKTDWLATLRNRLRELRHRRPAVRAGPGAKPRSSNGFYDLLRSEAEAFDDPDPGATHPRPRLIAGARH